MSQSAAIRPEPNFQRKAAIAHGGALEHTGAVAVLPIPDFDLGRTIFQTLEGKAARYVIQKRIAKDVRWFAEDADRVQTAYDALSAKGPLPEVSAALLEFLVAECNFDVEHADGSFLDHLYFCFEYGARHYPERSPLVLLLHSILGTGTNTFAMDRTKIPALRELVSPFEWTHLEAFPSVLRLLYSGELRRELRENLGRVGALRELRLQRVIDNAPITLGAEDFWVALNYQLIHLVDFMPAANWAMHQNDTSYIVLRDLYDLLERSGKLEARVRYAPPRAGAAPVGEPLGVGGWLTTRVPVPLSEKMASSSVKRFSQRIGHDLSYRVDWG
ncbi:MAG: hypothetical protein FJ095_20270 [Deltaproteobacteria bacterium]|nr:hypothetical protein [Deltaproteobacteria bacterium]